MYIVKRLRCTAAHSVRRSCAVIYSPDAVKLKSCSDSLHPCRGSSPRNYSHTAHITAISESVENNVSNGQSDDGSHAGKKAFWIWKRVSPGDAAYPRNVSKTLSFSSKNEAENQNFIVSHQSNFFQGLAFPGQMC